MNSHRSHPASRFGALKFRTPRAAAFALSVISAVPAFAQPIAIANPGFEANPVAPNGFLLLIPDGWSEYDPFNILDYGGDTLGVLNPTAGTNYPGGPPEGSHVGLVFLRIDVGDGPAGLTQVLGDTLQPNSRYTLTVQVGDIAGGFGPPPFEDVFLDLDGFPGYTVQLLAGGQVIAEDLNTLDAVLDDGQFALSTLIVETGAAHAQLGLPLEVRLINLNIPGTFAEPGIEVNFDDVRLEREDVISSCPGDADGDLDVDFDDLNMVLANWEQAVPPGENGDVAPEGAPDGLVNFDDLNAVLSSFGLQCD